MGGGKARFRGFYNRLPIVAVQYLDQNIHHPIQIVSPTQWDSNLLLYFGFHVQMFKGVWSYFYIYEHYDILLSQIFKDFPDLIFTDPVNNVIVDDFTTIIGGCTVGLYNLKTLNLGGHGILNPEHVALIYNKGKIKSVKLTNMIGHEANPQDDYVGLARIVVFLFRGQPMGYPEAMDFLARLVNPQDILFTGAFTENPTFILRHPIFWDSCKVLTFIYQVSGILTTYELRRKKQADNTGHYDLEASGAHLTSAINQIKISDWKRGFSYQELYEVSSLKPNSTCEFIRGVRNLSARNVEQLESFQLKFGRQPDEFYHFFRNKNCHVLIGVFKAVENHMRDFGGFPFTDLKCFDYWLISPNPTAKKPKV